MDWLGNAGVLWLIAAVLLAGTELLVPGIFLVFLALAAAITGAITLFVPDTPVGVQLISFAAWALLTVLIGKRWYREYPVESADPLLNDRVARLIGEVVTVSQAIEGGSGRVRVGDGEWPARGPDAVAGARVRVIGADGTTLRVEPLPPLPGP